MKLNQKAFTLVEILVVVGIMAFVVVGMGQLFIYTALEAELAGNKSIAVSLAQKKIEEIRSCAKNPIDVNGNGIYTDGVDRCGYDNIYRDYDSEGTPGNTFAVPGLGLNGIGLVRIDSSDAELLGIEVLIFWQDKYDRIIGEDQDFDGVFDGGEDTNGDSKLNTPITLVTKLTRR